jgi:aryl-alcohol dehydrogenase-like predicted oxidoreductase
VDWIIACTERTLKFILSHPAVTATIPGMRLARHVETNAAASDGKLLDQET